MDDAIAAIRRFVSAIEKIGIDYSSAEVVVLNNLEWFRFGNDVSKLQWEDAIGVLAVERGRLDEAYLDSWATGLGLFQLLSRAPLASL